MFEITQSAEIIVDTTLTAFFSADLVTSTGSIIPASPILTGLPTTQANAKEGTGVNVITGKYVNMIKEGIIDPVLVTKTALKNAVSVATTVLSADCVISNMRINESS